MTDLRQIHWDNLTKEECKKLGFYEWRSDKVDEEIAYLKTPNPRYWLREGQTIEGQIVALERTKGIFLIPLYLLPAVPIGTELISIDGEVIKYDGSNVEIDIKFGCIAYGIKIKEETPEPESENTRMISVLNFGNGIFNIQRNEFPSELAERILQNPAAMGGYSTIEEVLDVLPVETEPFSDAYYFIEMQRNERGNQIILYEIRGDILAEISSYGIGLSSTQDRALTAEVLKYMFRQSVDARLVDKLLDALLNHCGCCPVKPHPVLDPECRKDYRKDRRKCRECILRNIDNFWW